MSEPTIPPTNTQLSIPEQKPNRLRWIDMGRGFVMLYLILALAIPENIMAENPITAFLFTHPPREGTTISLYDLGAPAFMFVIGLSLSISFWAHKEKAGMGKAILREVIRYGLLLILGYFITLAVNDWDFSTLIDERNGYTQLYWDVIPALGAVGLVALPFVFIRKPEIRMICGYIWMLIYQILLLTTDTINYAKNSIYGGWYGSVFTFAAIVIIASALGDYILHNPVKKKIRYRNMAIFGALNVIIALAISFIPGWYMSKGQTTFSYGAFSIGVITLGCLVFVYFDEVLHWKLILLAAYGMNTFFSYFVGEFIYQIANLLLEVEKSVSLSWIFTGILVVVVSGSDLLLYWRKKAIKTEVVVLIFMGIVFALSFVV
jgi:hypothetical protein